MLVAFGAIFSAAIVRRSLWFAGDLFLFLFFLGVEFLSLVLDDRELIHIIASISNKYFLLYILNTHLSTILIDKKNQPHGSAFLIIIIIIIL